MTMVAPGEPPSKYLLRALGVLDSPYSFGNFTHFKLLNGEEILARKSEFLASAYKQEKNI